MFHGFKISRRLLVRRRKLKFAVQRRYVFRVRFHIKAARKKTVAVNTIAAPEAMLRWKDKYKPMIPESEAKTAAKSIIRERR